MSPNSYLLISASDYFSIKRKSLYGDRFMFIESVLKYLERKNIGYQHCFDSIRVFPHDLFHAKEICEYFGIKEIKYFEKGQLSAPFSSRKNIEKSFIGNFTETQPTLGLFGAIEGAIQGSFLK